MLPVRSRPRLRHGLAARLRVLLAALRRRQRAARISRARRDRAVELQWLGL